MMNTSSSLPKLGLIAGNGAIPAKMIAACKATGRELFVVALREETDPTILQEIDHIWVSLTEIGYILEQLREASVEEVVFVGGVKRPPLTSLKPDFEGTKLLGRILKHKMLGDSNILSTITTFIEEKGFSVIGADSIVEELTVDAGVLGEITPDDTIYKDITHGITIAKAIGKLDIGQAIIIQHGVVIGVEAVEGTKALLERSQSLLQGKEAAILIKCKKPQQERRIDLPTIGIDTIEQAHHAGLSGIAIEARNSLVIDLPAVIAAADRYGLFLIAVEATEVA